MFDITGHWDFGYLQCSFGWGYCAWSSSWWLLFEVTTRKSSRVTWINIEKSCLLFYCHEFIMAPRDNFWWSQKSIQEAQMTWQKFTKFLNNSASKERLTTSQSAHSQDKSPNTVHKNCQRCRKPQKMDQKLPKSSIWCQLRRDSLAKQTKNAIKLSLKILRNYFWCQNPLNLGSKSALKSLTRKKSGGVKIFQ